MVDGREEETRSSALVGFFLAAWKRVNSYRFSVLRREGIYAAAISYTHSNAMEKKNKKIKREERGTGEFRSRSPCNRSNSAAAEDRQRYFVVPIRRFPPLSILSLSLGCMWRVCVCVPLLQLIDIPLPLTRHHTRALTRQRE